ncbi:hypothetical protein [Streptomyces galbus]|uniref:hypothetical protein n=1 Tax=Streptomyces galbus TaxID=33898 RepID=UPI0019BFD0CE|nr:hypothetical protein GCM10010335_39290 [Streptomyces galbus]
MRYSTRGLLALSGTAIPSAVSDTLAPVTGSSRTAAWHSRPGVSAGLAPRTSSASTCATRS